MRSHAPAVIAYAARALPALYRSGPAAARRTVEFFTANIRNPNTRKACARAAAEFSAWCELQGLTKLAAIGPAHVAAYVETLQGRLSAPSVKLHLAAIRICSRLAGGRPSRAEQPGPQRPRPQALGQEKGRTPMLTAEKARTLLASIGDGSIVDLRDRALIALMVYTFARVGAALKIRVADVLYAGPMYLGSAA